MKLAAWPSLIGGDKIEWTGPPPELILEDGEGQRARPRARRNQGDDLPLRSARWFLEKPRATGPGSLGGPKSGP